MYVQTLATKAKSVSFKEKVTVITTVLCNIDFFILVLIKNKRKYIILFTYNLLGPDTFVNKFLDFCKFKIYCQYILANQTRQKY